jgi:ferredoxin
MSEIISRQALTQLVDAWLGQGKRVIAPCEIKPGLVLYVPIEQSSQVHLDALVRPGNTIKEAVFPRHEKLYGYRFAAKQIELIDAVPPETEQIVLGARPCDALSFTLLDHVFNWDFKDELYNDRRKTTTVVTLACQGHDEHCFCTSVGCSPADQRGSDAMLFDLGDGQLEVRCLTDKGNMLFCGRTEHSDREGTVPAGPEKKFDLAAIERFLADNFESAQWPTVAMRCMGCGACAYNCPTCHCFDIVDEGTGSGGIRARNWDACQFPMFTLHASGHNPRSNQGQRQRQRILHKFRIYREKFGVTLCTGCGNCTRNCPVSLGVRPVLEMLQQNATASAAEER